MALTMAFMLAVMLIAGHSGHPSHSGAQPAAPDYLERADPGDAAKHE